MYYDCFFLEFIYLFIYYECNTASHCSSTNRLCNRAISIFSRQRDFPFDIHGNVGHSISICPPFFRLFFPSLSSPEVPRATFVRHSKNTWPASIFFAGRPERHGDNLYVSTVRGRADGSLNDEATREIFCRSVTVPKKNCTQHFAHGYPRKKKSIKTK